MQKKKQTKPIKQIIFYIVLILIVLLITFSEDIIKLANKSKINLAENNDTQTTVTTPNPPRFVAGMIPIKWETDHFVITTKNDPNWYDYEGGKPAYVMLNDGYYRSEIERGVEPDQLMENNVGVGVPDDPSTRGTILMWIPRFAINNETNDIKYIQGIGKADATWTISDMFTHKQEETMPDFLLTGIWFETDVDTNYANKIATMNTKDSIYGFIANTKALASDQTTGNTIEKYIANVVGATSVRNTQENLPNVAQATEEYPSDITNPNRVILHIINQKNQDPIKAKASYSKDTGLIEVQVTYSQYGIEKILYENTSELKLQKNGRQATASTEGINIKYGIAKITIIDNKGNTKELELAITSKVYVTLYTDGTLGFCSNNIKIAEKTVSADYGDISEKAYGSRNYTPWYNQNNSQVKTVKFIDEISPISTAYWFYSCTNLAEIYGIENLNTSNVSNMEWMFCRCFNLTGLDVSNFDTGNVTNMYYIFCECTNLTSLDVNGFDTSSLTNVYGMFSSCSKLTELNLSNFNTSNVTNMHSMFSGCSGLTSIDLSPFDTSNVTQMSYMFNGCSGLASIDLSPFDTSNVTVMSYMFSGCSGLTSIDLASLDTSNVTSMSSMFSGCSGLTSIDLSPFDTSNVTQMSYMFNGCSGLASIDLSPFDTSNVTVMSYMFSGCSGLTSIDLASLDTSNVTVMQGMFSNCSKLTELNLSSFNTKKVTYMDSMFYYCQNLKTIYVGPNWKLASNRTNMFNNCGTSTTTLKK